MNRNDIEASKNSVDKDSGESNELPLPVFLLSLPRSGSTLLQRMLAAHPDIATTAEPNILLYPLLTLKEESLYSLADQKYYLRAHQEFVDRLPGKSQDFKSELGMFARRLYGRSMPSPTRFFLDKSPLYCYVAEELLTLFDEAKFIFLWRNPLATVVSRIRYTKAISHQWSIYHHPYFYDGLANLVQTFEQHQSRAIAIKYEDLVSSPETVLPRLLDYLELPNDHDLSIEFKSVHLSSTIDDHHAKQEEYQVLRDDRVTAWQKDFWNPVRKRWARNYLRWIGDERLAVMGYNLDDIMAELQSAPSSFDRAASDIYWMTFGFFFRLVNGRLLRNNLKKWRSGETFWGYR